MQELKAVLAASVKKLFDEEVEVELTRPDEQFGDYATNVALQLAKKTGKNPREVAEAVVGELKHDSITKAEVAGPGFINLSLTDRALLDLTDVRPAQTWQGKTVVAEYSDPNPFKILHAGHLYTSVVGDSIANLFEAVGATVHRVNFGGDVGLHVAKTIWAMLQGLGGEKPDELKQFEDSKVEWLSKCYVEGTNIYEDDEKAKAEIIELNKRIYQIVNDDDKDSPLAQIYWTTRQWSYDYFDHFYASIGSKFEKYYPESQTAGSGLEIVKANIGKVFEESDGAVVFKGEVHNLHTRVFINSEGLPTYETKDIGLIFKKWEDYKFDRSVVITANEIYEYMQVVLKAVEQIKSDLAERTTHLTHGLVKLAGGQKMSSRKGNILGAEEVLAAAAEANRKNSGEEQPEVVLGAVKYAFLKQRLGADIIYDPAESVSVEGNSGPYLQYAYVRAKNIAAKTEKKSAKPEKLEADERSLARKLGENAEVVENAAAELLPSHLATYLYELAQTFNRFYENNRVVGDEREAERLYLVEAYVKTLKDGLGLLGIEAPERM
jgi:arginyl-tRNA synthetase